jgi:hypothetical protein
MVSFTPWWLYPRQKSVPLSIDYGWMASGAGLDAFGKEINLCILSEIEPRFLGCAVEV